MRDYGIEPLVWGGSADGSWQLAHLGCEHEWDVREHSPQPHGDDGHAGNLGGGTATQAATRMGKAESAFCLRCNAWRGSLGLEPTPGLYVEHLVGIFREVKRVLRGDGTLWLNLGDSYSQGGGKQVLQTKNASHGLEGMRAQTPWMAAKQLLGIPWRVALALQADGWWLRSDIIWHKPNCMPESVRDRPTKSHEYLFLLSKSKRYYYDQDAIREPMSSSGLKRLESPTPARFGGAHKHKGYGTRVASGNPYTEANPAGRNRRTVWTIPTKPFSGAHFAVFPDALVEPCIKAGTSEKGACPECGKGWVRIVERTGHINQREAAHVPNNEPTKTDSTGWAPTTMATDNWQPACNCGICPDEDLGGDAVTNHPPVPIPCTVLDPFAGKGTVGEVAVKLGRNAVLIDLSPKYTQMAYDELHKELGGIFTEIALELT